MKEYYFQFDKVEIIEWIIQFPGQDYISETK
jgi:hypothetical protein